MFFSSPTVFLWNTVWLSDKWSAEAVFLCFKSLIVFNSHYCEVKPVSQTIAVTAMKKNV